MTPLPGCRHGRSVAFRDDPPPSEAPRGGTPVYLKKEDGFHIVFHGIVVRRTIDPDLVIVQPVLHDRIHGKERVYPLKDIRLIK